MVIAAQRTSQVTSPTHIQKFQINGEREIPGRQKVVRGSNIPALTSHTGLNHRSCTTLSLTASLVSGKNRLVTSAKRELSTHLSSGRRPLLSFSFLSFFSLLLFLFSCFFLLSFSFRSKHLPNIPNPDLVNPACKDTKTPPSRSFKTRRTAPSLFSFSHLPLPASSAQLLQSHPLFLLLFPSFFRLSFRTYRNNRTLRSHPRT